MTSETALDLDKIETFAKTLGVPWSIGYGADDTIGALQVSVIPTTFVFDRDGILIWNSFQAGTLDSAIRRAL